MTIELSTLKDIFDCDKVEFTVEVHANMCQWKKIAKDPSIPLLR